MTTQTTESTFDGGLLGLIGTNILAFLITVFTLGLAYPFALCIQYGWEVKHTIIDGKRLTFDGKGIQLMGNWFKWWCLSVITLGIYSFWLPIKLQQWKVKHTHTS